MRPGQVGRKGNRYADKGEATRSVARRAKLGITNKLGQAGIKGRGSRRASFGQEQAEREGNLGETGEAVVGQLTSLEATMGTSGGERERVLAKHVGERC